MANNLDVKDAAAATKTVKTTDNSGVHTPHHALDASANALGSDSYRNTSLQQSDQEIKSSAGNIYSISAHNPNDEYCYLHFYDALAANVTTTTAPTRTYPIPPGGMLDRTFLVPARFTTAISIAAATTVADAQGQPATGLVVQIEYK
jgi:hypothetical protein